CVLILRTHKCLSFFFQAEDGIRDATVTGVQTCALPISLRLLIDRTRSGQGQVVLVCGEAGIGKSRLVAEAKAYAAAQDFLLLQRSEERRVGKECRSGWVAEC